MGILASIAYKALSTDWLLSQARRKIAASGISVFTYHELGSDTDSVDVWQVVRKSDFLRQIDYLRRHYELVSLDDALTRIGNTPHATPLAVITFDDGHRGCSEHLLPIVERESLPVVLYLATGHISSQRAYWFDRIVNTLQADHVIQLDLSAFNLGKYCINEKRGAANWAIIQGLLVSIKSLDPHCCDAIADEISRQTLHRSKPSLSPLTIDQVREISANRFITIGAHSNGHEVLPLLNESDAHQSITRSIELIEEWTGKTPKHFAYPGGFCTPETIELVRRAGFASAVTARSGLWRKGDSVYEIPRFSVGRYDNLDKFKVISIRDKGILSNTPFS